jgi:hypothetical protein
MSGMPREPIRLIPASALRLVSQHELYGLQATMSRGHLPLDFEAKLATLEEGDLLQHFVAHHSRLFVALLLAAQEGWFQGCTPAERERLLRVLAYVRKDDDAIPDYRTDGYTDDYHLVRAATEELAPLIETFKLWRLRHQVPRMWSTTLCQNSLRMSLTATVPGSCPAQRRSCESRMDRRAQ